MISLITLDKVYLATKTIMTGVYVGSVGTLDVVCATTRAVMKIVGVL